MAKATARAVSVLAFHDTTAVPPRLLGADGGAIRIGRPLSNSTVSRVLAAGVLAHTHLLDYADILAIIEEEDPRQFTFTDDLLGWNDVEASLEEVREARQHRVISFGSCSFDDPREDLKRLGLLD